MIINSVNFMFIGLLYECLLFIKRKRIFFHFLMHKFTFFHDTGPGVTGFAVFVMVGKQTGKFNASISGQTINLTLINMTTESSLKIHTLGFITLKHN